MSNDIKIPNKNFHILLEFDKKIFEKNPNKSVMIKTNIDLLAKDVTDLSRDDLISVIGVLKGSLELFEDILNTRDFIGELIKE